MQSNSQYKYLALLSSTSLVVWPLTMLNIGMLCMQEIILGGEWITWNIVSDVYILTKGKKSINAEKNENVELPHTQVFCGRLCVLCE